MSETQYCDICKTDHPVDAFRYIGGGWEGTRNWYTLECLNTGELFTSYYDEQTEVCASDNYCGYYSVSDNPEKSLATAAMNIANILDVLSEDGEE